MSPTSVAPTVTARPGGADAPRPSGPGDALAEAFRPAPVAAGSLTGFTGQATTRALGFLRVSTVRGAACSLALGPADDGARADLLLVLHTAGDGRLLRHGVDVPCPEGSLFAHDPAELLTLREPGPFTLCLVRVPREALALTDARLRALTRGYPRPGGPLAAVLAPLAAALAAADAPYAPGTALHLAGTVTALAALLAAEPEGPRPPGPGTERRALRHRLLAHINDHLGERDLAPAGVAAAHHISIRYLHKLFADHGSTMARWIQHRRLEEARRELARPRGGASGVAAVASRWGFAGAAHFSRSFRTAYGMSPSDWRARHCRGEWP
ncbi:helix-turn-helix domain-containing protein [Streptomyces longispororuber]|uniref:helix-turn-helix domain-containing protein n=1 Tax=Streptomyces longispororuber TaxID=68230 RepID=UPI0033D4F0FC